MWEKIRSIIIIICVGNPYRELKDLLHPSMPLDLQFGAPYSIQCYKAFATYLVFDFADKMWRDVQLIPSQNLHVSLSEISMFFRKRALITVSIFPRGNLTGSLSEVELRIAKGVQIFSTVSKLSRSSSLASCSQNFSIMKNLYFIQKFMRWEWQFERLSRRCTRKCLSILLSNLSVFL